ncbi:DNA-directed RNA polymerase subunit omega [uncultured Clostridium sp.]|uniref:DNA-directed RNA polymerase subunit omega n=1 Tax=uncultured Clostridium sp. TaxID=59620 RepID=UPI0025F70659|nr:DNA-directed RNA polymerase subunit omega [uncultured Clostridium sp.]
MMVKPTVKELLEHAENRFALVIATSRRARQIANGDEKLTDVDEESPVTLAANEINEGKVQIYKADEEYDDENEDVSLLENEEKE